jgi:hypothetical protein
MFVDLLKQESSPCREPVMVAGDGFHHSFIGIFIPERKF